MYGLVVMDLENTARYLYMIVSYIDFAGIVTRKSGDMIQFLTVVFFPLG